MKIYNDWEFPGILRNRDQFFPIPVPVLFSGTNFSGTGTGTIQKKGEFPGPGQNRYNMGLFKRLRYQHNICNI